MSVKEWGIHLKRDSDVGCVRRRNAPTTESGALRLRLTHPTNQECPGL